jgi:FtsH-binding integral membrane protein
MSDFDRNYAAPARGAGADRALAIDQGLRAYMLRVYNTMAMGVALTGIVAWLAYQAAGGDAIVVTANGIAGLTAFGQAIFNLPVLIALMLATVGLVVFISFRIQHLQVGTALGLFLLYAGLFGLMLSSIFLAYTGASITRTFFISAASFGALSLYGYTTKRDLSPIGSFLVMGVFGLLLAMIVQYWLRSPGLEFVISIVGVLVFAGLTAWDTQRIKEMYDPQEDGTATGRKAVMGALSLYLDFINLFMFMLRFLGDRR